MGVGGGSGADVGVIMTTASSTPCSTEQGMAVACLGSWKRMRRRPALRRSAVKTRVRLIGAIDRHCAVAKSVLVMVELGQDLVNDVRKGRSRVIGVHGPRQ
ncbi:hypothetical protein UK14_08835 [Streptomyces sp. NRRL F-4428]|nr:hypothetical protein UK14_08835 [Streptomyces sp. NRRL F-4428]